MNGVNNLTTADSGRIWDILFYFALNQSNTPSVQVTLSYDKQTFNRGEKFERELYSKSKSYRIKLFMSKFLVPTRFFLLLLLLNFFEWLYTLGWNEKIKSFFFSLPYHRKVANCRHKRKEKMNSAENCWYLPIAYKT